MFTLRDFVIAGTDTTAKFIRWAIVLLTNHVSIQERLHKEIDAVIGRQRLPTSNDRSRLEIFGAKIIFKKTNITQSARVSRELIYAT